MRFWRRATSALLLLAVLAVAAAAVLYVTKDWLVALGVRVGIAEYNARMNSTMSVQDVALDLLTLTATARGVSIAQHGQTRFEAPIYVTQASAKVRLWPLMRRQVVLDEVAVSGVRVRLQVDGRARVNLAELFRPVKDDPHKPSPWNVIIRHFTVDQAMVNLAFEGQPLRASIDQMAFEGAFTGQPLHVHADMLRGQGDVTYLRRQGRLSYHLSQTAATVDVYRKRLVIDRLRVDAGEFTVLAQGGIDNAQVAGQFDIDLDLAAVAALIPAAPSPVGAVSLRGTLAGPLRQPRLQLAAAAEGVELGPYAASKLSADVNLTGRRLQLERFALEVAGGTIQGLGTLDLASEHVDIEVDVADVALASLGPLAARAAALVDGHVAGRMRLVSPSFGPEHLRVTGRLALSPRGSTQVDTRARPLLPLPLALTATFHFEHRTLTLEQAAWTLDGAQGQLTGTLSLDGALQVAGDVAADLAAQTFVHLGWPSARGEAKFTFEVGGTLPEPRLKADLQLRQARYRDIPIEPLALALEAEGSTVKIISLAGAQWGGRYRVTGAIELSTPLRSLPVNASAWPIRSISGLQVSVERMNLAQLALLLPTPVPLAGEVTLHAKGAGPWGSWRGAGQVDVRGLVVRGEALGDVSLALEGTPTQVTLKRLRAGVGSGQLSAHGSVALPGDSSMSR